jgi:hypothetical protein
MCVKTSIYHVTCSWKIVWNAFVHFGIHWCWLSCIGSTLRNKISAFTGKSDDSNVSFCVWLPCGLNVWLCKLCPYIYIYIYKSWFLLVYNSWWSLKHNHSNEGGGGVIVTYSCSFLFLTLLVLGACYISCQIMIIRAYNFRHEVGLGLHHMKSLNFALEVLYKKKNMAYGCFGVPHKSVRCVITRCFVYKFSVPIRGVQILDDQILYCGAWYCGFSVSNLLHVSLLASDILWWLIDFWEVCGLQVVNHVGLDFWEVCGLQVVNHVGLDCCYVRWNPSPQKTQTRTVPMMLRKNTLRNPKLASLLGKVWTSVVTGLA